MLNYTINSVLHLCHYVMFMLALLSSLQIQRMTVNVSDCGITSPSVRPLQHSMPLSETPKKKNQEQLLVEEKQITPKPMSPEHTSAPHTPPHFPNIDVSLRISTHSLRHLDFTKYSVL